jgi:S1-C subfamily serine protease
MQISTRVLAGVAAAALGASSASIASAQSPSATPPATPPAAAPTPPGWLGGSGYIGLRFAPLETADDSAAYPVLVDVDPQSPAGAVGLAAGDTIVSVNGRDPRRGAPVWREPQGTRFVVRVRRAGGPREFVVVSGPRPAAPPAPPR